MHKRQSYNSAPQDIHKYTVYAHIHTYIQGNKGEMKLQGINLMEKRTTAASDHDVKNLSKLDLNVLKDDD